MSKRRRFSPPRTVVEVSFQPRMEGLVRNLVAEYAPQAKLVGPQGPFTAGSAHVADFCLHEDGKPDRLVVWVSGPGMCEPRTIADRCVGIRSTMERRGSPSQLLVLLTRTKATGHAFSARQLELVEAGLAGGSGDVSVAAVSDEQDVLTWLAHLMGIGKQSQIKFAQPASPMGAKTKGWDDRSVASLAQVGGLSIMSARRTLQEFGSIKEASR